MRRFTVIECEQRSPEWFAARLGRLTGSRAVDMLAQTQAQAKTGTWGAARRNLLLQLVLERVTGKGQENGYVSKAMQDGIEREPAALGMYDAITGNSSVPSGFLAHVELMAGCSLDGYVGDFEGLVEVKCPQPSAHYEYLRSTTIPDDYLKQVVHDLWITGAQWCDWLSYQPEFPEGLQVRLIRVPRDEKAIDAYEKQVRAFLREVDTEEQAVRTMANANQQAVGA